VDRRRSPGGREDQRRPLSMLIDELWGRSARGSLDEGELLDELEGVQRYCGGYIQGVFHHLESRSSRSPRRKLLL